MDHVAQKRSELADRLNNDKLYIHPKIQQFSENNDEMFAFNLLEPTTKEMYGCCESQYTILLCEGNTLEDVLNKRGMELLQKVREKVKLSQFKDTISSYTVINSRCGMWVANKQSKYYDPSEGIEGYLCGWNNRKISGQSKHQGGIITSTCIFIDESGTDGCKWCYTYSGSLYKIQNKE